MLASSSSDSQRRQLIQDFVREFGGFVPPVRTMSELLAAKGCVAGRQTISTDYRERGYAKPAESQVPLPIEVPAQHEASIRPIRHTQ